MADDRKHVSLSNPSDVDHWTRRFGITGEQLEEIVARVGTDADRVAEEITKAASRLEPGPPSDQRSGARASKRRE